MVKFIVILSVIFYNINFVALVLCCTRVYEKRRQGPEQECVCVGGMGGWQTLMAGLTLVQGTNVQTKT